ncbi:serine hydrolase [Maribacter halichondriae]|uniref:serine hydrolase n=1 Tax=Maribacter halichondriae TaxID=2980554 RepID=UPI0030760706
MLLITRKIIPIIITLAMQMSCKTIVGQDSSQSKTVTNLVGKEIATDSLNIFLKNQMKALEVPGVSVAIINNGKVVYHTAKGYADIEAKKESNRPDHF